MDQALYSDMSNVEDRHWWFRGRRRIVEDLIRRLKLPADAAILDLGCGTGGNLPMLARYGKVTGCEMNAEAIALARGRGVATVHEGHLPDAVPLQDASFDVIVMTDVLEHVEPDAAALSRVRSLLRPGGRLVLTVPALPWLWTPRDEAHHHFRRYVRAGLSNLVKEQGLRVDLLSYYNTWLFPLVALARLVQKWRGGGYENDLNIPPSIINSGLAGLFASERFLLGRLPFPVGVSLILVASRPAE